MDILVFAAAFSALEMEVLCSFLFPQANEVFQRFLQSQAAIEKSILQSDKALTDGEKAMRGKGLVWLTMGRQVPAMPFGRCESKTFLQQGTSSSVEQSLLNLKTTRGVVVVPQPGRAFPITFCSVLTLVWTRGELRDFPPAFPIWFGLLLFWEGKGPSSLNFPPSLKPSWGRGAGQEAGS